MYSKEEDRMQAKIQWETEYENALSRAKAENKPVLLDFFNPE